MMPLQLLRRTPRSSATPTAVLILAANREAAVDMGMRVRALGCVAIEPRLDETSHKAISRLRPTVVMAQVGLDELACPGFGIAVRAVQARFIIFGNKWPEVVTVARRHGALSLPINAPNRMLRSAIQRGATPLSSAAVG